MKVNSIVAKNRLCGDYCGRLVGEWSSG